MDTEHLDWVHGLSFAPNGETYVTVSGHVGKNLHVYRNTEANDPILDRIDTGHSGGVMDVQHSPSGGHLITVAMDMCEYQNVTMFLLLKFNSVAIQVLECSKYQSRTRVPKRRGSSCCIAYRLGIRGR